MSEDILKAGLDWNGRDAYIVGSGPNAWGYYTRIPKDEVNPKIAVNKGIHLAPWFSLWLCITHPILTEPYFHEWMLRYLDNKTSITPVLAKGPLTEAYPKTPYHANIAQPYNPSDVATIHGYLRRGAGTVGCALQLAEQLGAARCILVGVDMCGDGYYDGTVNKQKRSMHPDGTWTQLPMLQRVVDSMKGGGMDVVSMTETKLSVEMI